MIGQLLHIPNTSTGQRAKLAETIIFFYGDNVCLLLITIKSAFHSMAWVVQE